MRPKLVLGITYLIFGCIYLVIVGMMIARYSLFQRDLISSRFEMFKQALRAISSGSLNIDQILFLGAILGIFGALTVGLTLIMIGYSLGSPRYRLPGIPVFFVIMFIGILCYKIWLTIKYANPGTLFDIILCLLILLYGWHSRRAGINRSTGEGSEIVKRRRWAFYLLLAGIVISMIFSLLMNARIPIGTIIQ